MKLKALLLALCTAGFAVTLAFAASPAPNENGKPRTGSASTGTTGKHEDKADRKADRCKPARKLELKGEFVAAGSGGFAMTVKKGNRGAKAFTGRQATVLVDAKTRFHGAKRALANLVVGDRLMVQGFACKADAVAGSLLARKVGVKGAAKAEQDEVDKDEATNEDDEDDENDQDDENDEDEDDDPTGTTTGS